jgi:formylglycine-generating enzyme required for sulfatase activity
MGTEPWKRQSNSQVGEHVAASYVSAIDAEQFCLELTERERVAGRLGSDAHYRLPTEAEWEYACRAGTTTQYSFGNDGSQLIDYAWCAHNTMGQNYPHAVGLKKPNAWGLYDFHGNVSEWCSDWNGNRRGGHDPQGPSEGSARVSRGGTFGGWDKASQSNSMAFSPRTPGTRTYHLGFRVVLSWVVGDSKQQVGSAVAKPTNAAPPLAVAPFDADQAKAHQEAWAKHLGVPVEKEVKLPGGEKMTFMLIPPGEFMMGSSVDERSTQRPTQYEQSPRQTLYSTCYETTFWLKVRSTRSSFRDHSGWENVKSLVVSFDSSSILRSTEQMRRKAEKD